MNGSFYELIEDIKLKQFILTEIQPYRSQYVELTEEGWKVKHNFLSEHLIECAVRGIGAAIGYYHSSVIKVVGIEIDDHEGSGWSDTKSASYLWFLYNELTGYLPVPSLLFHSPHGLHCYWILITTLPTQLIIPLIKERLKPLSNIEVKPTMTEALRIPERKRAIDPRSGDSLHSIDFTELVTYDPIDVIGISCDPSDFRKTLSERKASLRSFIGSLAIERVEEQYTSFVDGSSNKALNHLVPVYKKVGLSVDEAISRITSKLDVSPLYSLYGELRNPTRLKKRIESYYRNRSSVNSFTTKSEVLSKKDRKIIDTLVAIHPWAKQRTKPIQKFLENLFGWLKYHEKIIQNKSHFAMFDYLYPYYRKNMREGYIPLPGSVMSKWNDRYNQIVSWLIKIHFLEPAPYPYAPAQGICRYYKVNQEYKSAETYKNI